MKYSLTHLSDSTLAHDMAAMVAGERTATAGLLAYLAEFDARRLYLPAAHPSMHSYCVRELGLCEQAAFHRIRAARTARRFPAIFAAVAEGRLHLSGVVLLTPHLTVENASELLAAAERKSKFEIERLLAERFPRPDLPARVQALSLPPAPGPVAGQLSPGIVDLHAPEPAQESDAPLAPGLAPSSPRGMDRKPKLAPLAPQRFALQLTMGQEMHDDLRYAQELLGHQVPSGDIAQVLHRALKALIGQLEKQKFAATHRPRSPRRSTHGARHVPAHVKRTVWERDQGQCTFVNESGQRCPARRFLEFDHIDPVARGGQATVTGMRLRCRAHNQYGAECAFGAEFMRRKRQEARRASADARRVVAKEQDAREQARKEQANEVIPWLRALGFRADEARRAAELCETIPEASLEERVRRALCYFNPRTARAAPAAG